MDLGVKVLLGKKKSFEFLTNFIELYLPSLNSKDGLGNNNINITHCLKSNTIKIGIKEVKGLSLFRKFSHVNTGLDIILIGFSPTIIHKILNKDKFSTTSHSKLPFSPVKEDALMEVPTSSFTKEWEGTPVNLPFPLKN